MSKIKRIDRKTLDEFRTGFEKAVKSFGDSVGVAIKLGGIRFNDTSFTGKLEVVIVDTASGMTAEEALGRKSLNLEGFLFGISERDYGRTFKNWDGKTYKLVGIKSSRPKYPVVAKDVRTGKSFKFPEDVLKKLSK